MSAAPDGDPRFTFGLVYETLELLRAHGYNPDPGGRDHVEVSQALFHLLYVTTDIGTRPPPEHDPFDE